MERAPEGAVGLFIHSKAYRIDAVISPIAEKSLSTKFAGFIF